MCLTLTLRFTKNKVMQADQFFCLNLLEENAVIILFGKYSMSSGLKSRKSVIGITTDLFIVPGKKDTIRKW